MSNDFEPKSSMTRRRMLHHLGVTSVSAVTLAGVAYKASSVLTPTPAYASEATPLEGIDVSHATPDLVDLLTGFFAAKNAHDPVKTMAYFSQNKLTYIDGTLGWAYYTWQDLNALLHNSCPHGHQQHGLTRSGFWGTQRAHWFSSLIRLNCSAMRFGRFRR